MIHLKFYFMGLFDILWGKHGHKKDKTIQELFAALRRSEENEAKLIKQNEHLEHDRDRLENELLKCLNKKEPKAFYLTARYQILS